MSPKEKYKEYFRQYDLPIFFHPDWLDIVSAGKWQVEIWQKGEKLGFWIYQKKSKVGISYNLSFQYTPYSGFYFLPQADFDDLSIKRAVNDLTKKTNIDYHNFFLSPWFRSPYPFVVNGFTVISKYSYIKNLENPNLLESFESRLRSKIEKNIDTISVKEKVDAQSLIQFHDAAYSGRNPFDSSLLRQLYDRFGGEKVYVLAAHQDQRELGAIFLVRDGHRMYYLAGGVDKTSKSAMPVLLYQAMLYAQKKGCTVFDFHGSSIPSIERFFRKFDPEVESYFVLKKSSKKKAQLLDLFIS